VFSKVCDASAGIRPQLAPPPTERAPVAAIALLHTLPLQCLKVPRTLLDYSYSTPKWRRSFAGRTTEPQRLTFSGQTMAEQRKVRMSGTLPTPLIDELAGTVSAVADRQQVPCPLHSFSRRACGTINRFLFAEITCNGLVDKTMPHNDLEASCHQNRANNATCGVRAPWNIPYRRVDPCTNDDSGHREGLSQGRLRDDCAGPLSGRSAMEGSALGGRTTR
jgi:hypothetical protein